MVYWEQKPTINQEAPVLIRPIKHEAPNLAPSRAFLSPYPLKISTMFVSVSAWIGGHPKTREPRDHTALMWDSVPREGSPETREFRNHTALRGNLVSRGIAAARGGDPQLSQGAQVPQPCSFSPLHCFFMASSDERVTPGRKPHERDLMEGSACRGTNLGMAALCSQEWVAGNWTKGRVI